MLQVLTAPGPLRHPSMRGDPLESQSLPAGRRGPEEHILHLRPALLVVFLQCALPLYVCLGKHA